ncbi:MAG: hypothetical protein HQL48_11535 [Gammaproteobacteria bacterium]|nr:hypothetical protein [Gammaproteobacteria bacterium]
MATTLHPLPHLLHISQLYPEADWLHAAAGEISALKLNPESEQRTITEGAQLYRQLIERFERMMWERDLEEEALCHYQQLFQELEELLALQAVDDRYRFVVIIPVAERPQHLHHCLQSLLRLCKRFHYGGIRGNGYSGVRVVVADDSGQDENISRHRQLAVEYSRQGLEVLYFGLDDQAQLLRETAAEKSELASILPRVVGEYNPASFHHKGASAMRNIIYLKLMEIEKSAHQRQLYFFVDSDQEFQVTVDDGGRGRELYAINYFDRLNRIFSEKAITLLTGKVVGDPPVSPAVMAANCLCDVNAFLQELVVHPPEGRCHFHQQQLQCEGEAAYHDHAALFGFTPAVESYRYRCDIESDHQQGDCFGRFSGRINRFFYGEHPTRRSYYQRGEAEQVVAARTVYTGNYVMTAAGLRHFIPFAPLRLRMAGPVLGRILKKRLGNAFVSANLPLLHRRTVADSGVSEFRPGVEADEKLVDLSGEFERQFFGDLLLFTMEALVKSEFPEVVPTAAELSRMMLRVEENIRTQYLNKRLEIGESLQQLRRLLEDVRGWSEPLNANKAVAGLERFIATMDHNFGKDARSYTIIEDSQYCGHRREEIVEAILHYINDEKIWGLILTCMNGAASPSIMKCISR